MKSLFYLLLLPVFLFSTRSQAQTGPLCSFTLPEFMPDRFVGSFTMQVGGAVNPVLGENGQGICRVYLSIEHEYIGDLNITLTTPNGQTVNLIGPVGLFGPTDNSSWNVNFLPCNAPVAPDASFSPVWDNEQEWGIGNQYDGSYYPYSGCLQDLTGSVNGAWTLTISDDLDQDVGVFYSFGIEFCDASGMACSECRASGGFQPEPDVKRCVGDPALNLDLVPHYINPSLVPPADEYDYTYLISRTSDGVLLNYDADADLSSFPPGSYTVCGLSYHTDATSQLPVPNGSLTTAQLFTQLYSTAPPFCGQVSGFCVGVIIQPEPQDSILTTSICSTDCLNFFDTIYCSPGTYVRTITQNNCTFTATLNLSVVEPVVIHVQDTVCAGSCSTLPGFENACASGTYEQFLPASLPDLCDTLVQLQLLVTPPVAVIETVQIVQPSAGQPNGLIDIQVTGGPGPFSYAWYQNATLIATTEDLSDIGPGTYQFIVTGISGCSDTASYVLTNTMIVGGHPASSLPGLRNNPGSVPVLMPFNGTLPAARLRVYDNSGRLVWEQETQEDSGEHPIDLGRAPDGLYFLEMQEEGVRSVWMKMVIQH